MSEIKTINYLVQVQKSCPKCNVGKLSNAIVKLVYNFEKYNTSTLLHYNFEAQFLPRKTC